VNIQSVRDLKKEVLTNHVLPLSLPEAGPRLAIAARSLERLETQPRTIAIGVAKATEKDFKLAVRIQNSAVAGAEFLRRIEQLAAGEVDTRFIGRIVKRAPWHQERQRPLLIGSSIGHVRITAGTLGCFVKAGTDAGPRILSNNHVLADENSGSPGDEIIQPGHFDGGSAPADVVGTLDTFVPLDMAGINRVDAALAKLAPGIAFDKTTLTGFGQVKGLADEIHDIGGAVAKVGRTTGVTHGRVTAFELDNVIVGYDIGNLRFDGQIEVEGAGAHPFSRGGDSGSLVVDEGGLAVGLLFAGGETGGTNGMGLTFVNPIRAVLTALSAELLI
jgi:hypothetical protein